jgi:hypothetical protein
VAFQGESGKPGEHEAESAGLSIMEFHLAIGAFLRPKARMAGGGFFRLFPFCITRFFLNRVNEVEEWFFIFYFHPWEIDPEVPRIEADGIISRFRTYVNLGKMEAKLRRLLEDFSFCPLRMRIREMG